MNIFSLSGDLKLLTLNKAFIALPNGRRCRSKEYITFAAHISRMMLLKAEAFREFNESFDPYKHEIRAYLEYKTPDLYTKDGRISKNSGDMANMEKPLVDNVMMGSIDDSAIVQWEMRKTYSDKYAFLLILSICERRDNHSFESNE